MGKESSGVEKRIPVMLRARRFVIDAARNAASVRRLKFGDWLETTLVAEILKTAGVAPEFKKKLKEER